MISPLLESREDHMGDDAEQCISALSSFSLAAMKPKYSNAVPSYSSPSPPLKTCFSDLRSYNPFND